MQNYVLEGLIDRLINEKDLQFLRAKVEFLIIPFMDKDGARVFGKTIAYSLQEYLKTIQR